MKKQLLLITCFLLFQTIYGQSIPIDCVNVTSNIYLQLQKETSSPESPLIPAHRFISSDHIWYALINTTTNYVSLVYPPKDRRFACHLFDTHGQEIQKVKKDAADQFKENPRNGANLSLRPIHISPKYGYVNNLMIPDEYFVMTNKGIYTLQVQIRTLAKETNGLIKFILTKPIHVEIEKK